MSNKEKLLSSALNGITAYEDDKERRIRIEDILKIKKKSKTAQCWCFKSF